MRITIKPIDPSAPKEHQRRILAALFFQTQISQNGQVRYGWGTVNSYDVVLSNFYNDNVYYSNVVVEVRLTKKVIRYKSKHAQANRDRMEDNRYAVLNEGFLGAGGFGSAIPVEVTYKFTQSLTDLSFKDKPRGKRRIAKRAAFDPRKEEQWYEGFRGLRREYHIAARTPHVSPKQPVIYDKNAYMVERLMEGSTLGDILDGDRTKSRYLTLEERFALCINLLEAFKEQVFAVKIVHRDLKPENIVIDKDWSVKTIDFGLSKLEGETVITENVGSFGYISPEAMQSLPTDYRSDLFALGRMIGAIWWNSNFFYDEALKGNVIKAAQAEDYKYLFMNLDGLKTEVRTIITDTLKGLTAFEQEKRIHIDDAINNMKKASDMQFKQKEETVPAEQSSPPREKKGLFAKWPRCFLAETRRKRKDAAETVSAKEKRKT